MALARVMGEERKELFSSPTRVAEEGRELFSSPT